MQRFKRTIFGLAGLALAIIAVAFSVISPLTKYLIEKHDQKYTGRKITMDWAYANPFTGYLYIKNLKIYERLNSANEPQADSIFISARSLSLNFALLKLPFNTYEVSELTLDHPRGKLIQNKNDLNLNDLIERFFVKRRSASANEPSHISILNVKITDGEFYYCEQSMAINYFIREVNVESSGKRWGVDSIQSRISFVQGVGPGSVKGNITINVKNRNYRFAAVVHEFDLNIIHQYLKELTNYQNFAAKLEADIIGSGNFGDQENITTSGRLVINDFHLGKSADDDYLSFERFTVNILELSPKKHRYFCDSISLDRPYFKYEKYDSLDNLQMMFGRGGSKIIGTSGNRSKFNLVIQLARYIKVLSRNFFESDYKIRQLTISNGTVKFNDFSLSEKFALELNPVNITADSIDKNDSRVKVLLQSRVKEYGELIVSLSLNPNDTGDFDLRYRLQNVPLAMFNPYMISYTSFALDRGTLGLEGVWKVRKGLIKSKNHLTLIDLRQARQLESKDTKWLPLPLIMRFIREPDNVIDYQIPITGNMRNPKFHFRDVLFDLHKNILFKLPSMPYAMQVRNIKTAMEKSFVLQWPMRGNQIRHGQEKFIERMVDFLVDNPGESVSISPQQYSVKEKEYITFFEAKKKYFLQAAKRNELSFTAADEDAVNKLSIKSDLFTKYLNGQVNDSLIFTIEEKCVLLVGSAVIHAKFLQLSTERRNMFMSYFIKRKVENQVKFSPGVNVIPHNGFSFYQIQYNGKLPKSLLKAYKRSNEWDELTRKGKSRKAPNEAPEGRSVKLQRQPTD
jgi:hypothetical protein